MFESILQQIPSNPSKILEFIIIYVILRGIFGKWLGVLIVKYIFSPLEKRIKRLLIKTERDVAIWMHYRNKALHKGHKHSSPVTCNEDGCIII